MWRETQILPSFPIEDGAIRAMFITSVDVDPGDAGCEEAGTRSGGRSQLKPRVVLPLATASFSPRFLPDLTSASHLR